MKIKLILLSSALASIVALSTNVAFAGYGGYQDHKMCKHHGKKHGYGMNNMSEKLGLSEEQQAKIKAIKKEKKTILRSLRKQKYEIKNKLHQLDPKSPNFKTEIFSLAAEKGKIAQRMVVEKGEMRFKIASVLTDEQLAKKKEWRQKGKGKQGKHFCNYCKHKKGCQKKGKRNQQQMKKIKEI